MYVACPHNETAAIRQYPRTYRIAQVLNEVAPGKIQKCSPRASPFEIRLHASNNMAKASAADEATVQHGVGYDCLAGIARLPAVLPAAQCAACDPNYQTLHR